MLQLVRINSPSKDFFFVTLKKKLQIYEQAD